MTLNERRRYYRKMEFDRQTRRDNLTLAFGFVLAAVAIILPWWT